MATNDHSNGEQGVTHHRVTVVQVMFDHDTSLVSFAMRDVRVGLAQMMLDEALRQLDIMRRQAAAMELRQQMADEALAKSIIGKMGPRG